MRKRCAGNGGGAARIAAGQGCPSAFHAKEARRRPVMAAADRVRHAWGGGMMRWRSVWMGAGGSGVFSLRCRIGRSAKAMRRCALRRCSCGSARCRQTASEAGRIVFSRDYALWISRLQSGGGRSVRTRNRAGVGAKRSLSGEVPDSLCSALAAMRFGAGAFPVCRRGTSLPPGRTRFGSLVFLLFFVARKLN